MDANRTDRMEEVERLAELEISARDVVEGATLFMYSLISILIPLVDSRVHASIVSDPVIRSRIAGSQRKMGIQEVEVTMVGVAAVAVVVEEVVVGTDRVGTLVGSMERRWQS